MIATSRKITECDRFQANERQQAEIDQKTEKTRETPGMPGFRSKHWKNHLPQGFTNLDAFCLLQTCKHKRKLEAQRVTEFEKLPAFSHNVGNAASILRGCMYASSSKNHSGLDSLRDLSLFRFRCFEQDSKRSTLPPSRLR